MSQSFESVKDTLFHPVPAGSRAGNRAKFCCARRPAGPPCPPNFGRHKGVQAKSTFKAGRASRPGGAQNQQEVPRRGSAGWRPEPKRSRVGAKRSCRAQRQRFGACVFGQLTPTKMSLGELELRQTPLPLCCPKGRVWLAPTPFDTDRRDTRSSDPRRGQELGVRLHVWFPVTDLIPVTAVRARCRAPAGNRGNSSTQRLQTPLPSRGTQF